MALDLLHLSSRHRRLARRTEELESRIQELIEQRDAARDQRDYFRGCVRQLEAKSNEISAGVFEAGSFLDEAVYFVSRRAGLAYLQIPKAACTTVKAVLIASERGEPVADMEATPRSIYELHHGEPVLDFSPEVEDCFRFTFVRHPFDRFFSFYFNQIDLQKPSASEDKDARMVYDALAEEMAPFELRPGMAFGDYCDAVFSTPHRRQNSHVRRQVDYLFAGGTLAVDFVGRVEQFESDLERVLAHVKEPDQPRPPRLNATVGYPGWKECDLLTPTIREKLRDFYQDDLLLLGFEDE